MRLVALVVGLAVTAVVAVVVFSYVGRQNEDALSVLGVTTTTAAVQAVLPGAGGQPLPLDTAPDAVRPGVPPVVQAASAAACAADKASLQAAVDVYMGLQAAPPHDEQAMIDAGVLREASALWDVRDGVLVPQNPACT